MQQAHNTIQANDKQSVQCIAQVPYCSVFKRLKFQQKFNTS